jgi:hypothetical protein
VVILLKPAFAGSARATVQTQGAEAIEAADTLTELFTGSLITFSAKSVARPVVRHNGEDAFEDARLARRFGVDSTP